MARVVNRSKQLLIMPLNSGGTVHLAPGETSRELPDFELADNPAFSKLTTRGLAVVDSAAAPAREDAS